MLAVGTAATLCLVRSSASADMQGRPLVKQAAQAPLSRHQRQVCGRCCGWPRRILRAPLRPPATGPDGAAQAVHKRPPSVWAPVPG